MRTLLKNISTPKIDYELFTNIILSRYYQTHDIYHNAHNHIIPMLTKLECLYQDAFSKRDLRALVSFTLMHDAVHDVLIDNDTSVENSIKELQFWRSGVDTTLVEKLIRTTKYDWTDYSKLDKLQQVAVMLDLTSLTDLPVDKAEPLFLKEYQHIELSLYKTERIKVLSHIDKITGNKFNLMSADRREWLENYTPKIAVFAGSFNPFHVGHLNIIEQAEKTFDKVIVAIGQNPDKPANEYVRPAIPNQVDNYTGLLVDYIKSKSYPVTLIRGLRNISDLQSEINFRSTLKDLYDSINIVYLICDSEYSHISSTMIRGLEKYGKESMYTL